jgi:hypothetical protein
MGTSQTSSECRSPARRGPSGSAVLRLVRHCCTGHVAHDEVVDRRRVVPGRVGRHLEITNVEVVRVHRPIGVVPDYLGSDRRIVRIEQRKRETSDVSVQRAVRTQRDLRRVPFGSDSIWRRPIKPARRDDANWDSARHQHVTAWSQVSPGSRGIGSGNDFARPDGVRWLHGVHSRGRCYGHLRGGGVGR